MEQVNRNTSQFILPLKKVPPEEGDYDIYPVHSIGSDKIYENIENLFEMLPEEGKIIIDGYAGILFEPLIAEITDNFKRSGKAVPALYCIDEALLPAERINSAVSPFTGGD